MQQVPQRSFPGNPQAVLNEQTPDSPAVQTPTARKKPENPVRQPSCMAAASGSLAMRVCISGSPPVLADSSRAEPSGRRAGIWMLSTRCREHDRPGQESEPYLRVRFP